jgi:phosphate/sulfate permease
MSVSASVIATASSLALPVSTTYVAFSAVVATGMADRIFQRGDAELKLGRAIWVVSSWVLSALIAVAATAIVATAVYRLEVAGMIACLVVNLIVRRTLKRRADLQAKRVAEEAYERAHPEEFALEQESA